MGLDGVHHIGVARVLGAGGDVRLAAAEGSEVGKRCEQLAELLECLDPELTQDAERFARTWRCQGTTILRLERNARRLRAVVPGHGVVEIVGTLTDLGGSVEHGGAGIQCHGPDRIAAFPVGASP